MSSGLVTGQRCTLVVQVQAYVRYRRAGRTDLAPRQDRPLRICYCSCIRTMSARFGARKHEDAD